jgi:spore germination cell wall hydrolase CwlJ-like protein
MKRLFFALLLSAAPVFAEVSDRELFASLLILEAAGEGERGMHAVANVVHNRAVKRDSTYRQEILRSKQFSSVTGKTTQEMVNRARKDRNWKKALDISDREFTGWLPDITNGATHFHSGSSVWWSGHMRRTARVGKHLFYVERL